MSKSKLPTKEECQKLLGTEFLYCDDKTKVKAFVAAIDPEIGITCDFLDLQAANRADYDCTEDDMHCLCLARKGYEKTYDFKILNLSYEESFNQILEEIKKGKTIVAETTMITDISACAFK